LTKKSDSITIGAKMSSDNSSYLQWLVSNTKTSWWHDSADPAELAKGLADGAVGVTTNPLLSYQAIRAHPERWTEWLRRVPANSNPAQRAEAIVSVIVRRTAEQLLPVYTQTQAEQGYVCAQVNPALPGDRDAMLAMARRFHAIAPNIAVKLPVTAAGLDVLGECSAEGITTTGTVSFTVAQAIAVAERHRRGQARALKAGRKPCRSFATIMIGRLDDYLRDAAADRRAPVSESDIQQAGLAVVKRAYEIYREMNYDTSLIIAALRGVHHMVGLAGAQVIMSIHPANQAKLTPDVSRQLGIETPVPNDVLDRLQTIPDFIRAYEPDGLAQRDFIAYGASQRTLSQFVESGWRMLETYPIG
jgi:transaldolase